MLGWDVGTFEFASDRILALNYNHHAKLKMRTGGSIGSIGKTQARKLDEGDGYFWDLAGHDHRNSIKLPVKYRYRSPVVIEFHIASQHKPDAYAVIWLQHLIDNEDTPINIPIWRTSMGSRLTQNYITEHNARANDLPGLEDLKEVGRLQFRARFKAGMDESHERFVSDNNSRETYETWEACLAEGVRTRIARADMPEKIQKLHDESLTEGRDVLKSADNEEKKKWLSRDGTDWSGAFGHDPKAYMSNGQKKREPGAEPPLHDPVNPSSDDDDDDSGDDASSDDLGIKDGNNMNHSTFSTNHSGSRRHDETSSTANGTANGDGDDRSSMQGSQYGANVNKQNKRTEQRKQRGIMQWKPARNLKFAKDEGVLGLRKIKAKITGGLNGRQPGVESET